jgi:RNA polymerase sigma-70 factor (ECF subfamily)
VGSGRAPRQEDDEDEDVAAHGARSRADGGWRRGEGSERMDEAGWLALYRETVAPLYAFVARRCGGDRALAEDVTQEAWLRAVDAWRRRGAPREPLAWLQTTARRLLIDWARGEGRRRFDRVELALDEQVLAPTTPRAVAAVQQALARLRAPDAALLEEFHFDGRSVREIAAAAGASEKAIEGRLRRARYALAARLRPWLEETRIP